MSGPSPRSHRSPWLALFADVLGWARWTKSWSLVPLIVLIAFAVFLSFVSFAVLPWLIYPGL